METPLDNFTAWKSLYDELQSIKKQIEELKEAIADVENFRAIATFTPEQLKTLMEIINGAIRAIAKDLIQALKESNTPFVN